MPVNPNGRDSDYHPDFCDMLIEHMSKGLSFESFAGEIGVSRDTIYQWAKKNQAFSDAKKKGTELCRGFWERMGVAGAAGKIPGFNCAAWIFNMKNRFRDSWHDRTFVIPMTPEQAHEADQELLDAVPREKLIELAGDKK